MDTSEKSSTNARNSNSSSSVSEQLKEQLQTISSTISQLSSSITGSANSSSGPKSVQELAVLQATLFSLQQQQLLQMQILSQMSQQRGGGGKEGGSGELAVIDPRPPEATEQPPGPQPAAVSPADGAAAATRVMAELAKKMQLAPSFEEKKQGWTSRLKFH